MKEELKIFLRESSKNLILGFAGLGLVLDWFFGIGLFFFLRPGLLAIHPDLSYIVFLGILGILLIISGGLVIITFSVYTGIDLLYPHGRKQITLTALLPLIYLLSNVMGVSKDKIRYSYIALHNALWSVQYKRLNSSRILILLPHCIQLFDCPYKITHNIQNCRECGKCDIAAIKHLSDQYGIAISVATGGTLARKIVVETRPTFIIAVACERDLSLGIQEVYPIPTYGLLNSRPNGPCINTQVDVEKLEKIIQLVKRTFQEPEHGLKS